jgi:hypothetical protein
MKLTISDDCSDCGKCEVFLPGIIERVESGPMNINEKHPDINWGGIRSAIAACPIGAMELK